MQEDSGLLKDMVNYSQSKLFPITLEIKNFVPVSFVVHILHGMVPCERTRFLDSELPFTV